MCVCYLLRNGTTYGGEIWHADACRPCAGPLRGFMSIGVTAAVVQWSLSFAAIYRLGPRLSHAVVPLASAAMTCCQTLTLAIAALDTAAVRRRLFWPRWCWLGALMCPGLNAGWCTTLFNGSPRFGRDVASWKVVWWVGRVHRSVSLECLLPVTWLWVAGAGWDTLQWPRAAGYALSHLPIHYAHKCKTEREAWYVFTGWSTTGTGHWSWNRAKQGFSLLSYTWESNANNWSRCDRHMCFLSRLWVLRLLLQHLSFHHIVPVISCPWQFHFHLFQHTYFFANSSAVCCCLCSIFLQYLSNSLLTQKGVNSLKMLINGVGLPCLQVLLAQRSFSVNYKVGSHTRK